jgi:hypothetical protein
MGKTIFFRYSALRSLGILATWLNLGAPQKLQENDIINYNLQFTKE